MKEHPTLSGFHKVSHNIRSDNPDKVIDLPSGHSYCPIGVPQFPQIVLEEVSQPGDVIVGVVLQKLNIFFVRGVKL